MSILYIEGILTLHVPYGYPLKANPFLFYTLSIPKRILSIFSDATLIHTITV